MVCSHSVCRHVVRWALNDAYFVVLFRQYEPFVASLSPKPPWLWKGRARSILRQIEASVLANAGHAHLEEPGAT